MEQFGPGVAVLLGMLEGLTEYLPVSSTGHLILAGHCLGFTGHVAVSVEICIQLGAVLAVVAYERAKIRSLLSHANRERRSLRRHLHLHLPASSFMRTIRTSVGAHHHLWFLIGLGAAFLPAALVGLLAHEWIEAHLFSPRTVALSLIMGGVVILIVETWPGTVRCTVLEHVGLSRAVGVGLAQCMALIPGTSRSGSTIVGGLLLGLDRKVATEFSFFLALPTMFAATGYKFVQSYHLFNTQDLLALFIGMVVSFLVAWAVIAAFLSYVKRHTLKVFGYYRVGLGTIILIVL
ncbi:MAG: undecaprenyl-diphosphate phosphatase [Nitrospira sp. SB0677_bin_15]|nr:undecaprenyl-diphosphate phosphatase [Nitrospira sp. SB0667_bin_9]MYD30663.1 undecaprenyl-diphosphate phosphatase [Nitrospira sp. SB0661_bin_20]MYG39408.1 undecaprenyl-diphosphate phosphatase [Nitrospira sp. SB0677_bin_15]MYH01102.1 undecaprenyl-diphosphate phosphatase [Nitrospira sp. SB0675_bin_23]MYJ23366.1 undecaprenyl-diphosphate phosphatase [Nitrospira sp. SB0673_bin_12]